MTTSRSSLLAPETATSDVSGDRARTYVSLTLLAVPLMALLYMLSPVATAVVAVPLGAYGFTFPAVRLAWLLVGALVLLDSTAELSTAKLAYFAGIAIGVAISVFRLSRRSHPSRSLFRYAWLGCTLLTGWITCVSLPYATFVQDVPLATWSRDAFSHLLIAAAVIIAADAAGTITLRSAKFIAVATGVAAIVQYSITWTARRGVLGDEVIYLFGSRALVVVPVAMGIVYGLLGPGVRARWLMLSLLGLAGIFVTGVRSGFLVLAAFLGCIGTRRRGGIPPWKILPIMVVALAIGLWGAYQLAPFLGGVDFLADRVARLTDLLRSGDILADASARQRVALQHEALVVFEQAPALGTGLGSIAFVDTPAVYLAEWGALGTAALIASLVLIARSCVAMPKTRIVAEVTVARSAFAAWSISLVSAAPTDDKGFAIGIGLVVLLVGCGLVREAGQEQRSASVELAT